MRVLHVISFLRKSAGSTVFVVELCNCLVKNGVSCAILVLQKTADDELPDKAVSVYEGLSCLETLPRPDIIHVHGVWELFIHRVVAWGKANKIPIVLSPHGLLMPWRLRYKRLKKWLALACYQYRDLQRVSMFHATAASEVEAVRRLRLKQSACIVPLGVALPHKNEIRQISSRQHQGKRKTLLFISRVHPTKGLINLVDAWVQLKKIGITNTDRKIADGWCVLIAGPSEVNHADEVMMHAREKDVAKDFQMLGPVYGAAKDELYKNADLFVLPTFSENFGSVIIEALAWGCPVITTKGTPWQELEESECGWWIDIGVEPLVAVLQKAMTLTDDERMQMGLNGRRLVEEKYSWATVSAKMLDGYKGLCVVQ